MITIVSKLPYHIYSRNCRYGIHRLNNAIRKYSKDPNTICPPPKSKKDASSGTAYTIGAITLIGVGTIAYASYDKDFRKFMGDNVPGADGLLKFFLQEEKPMTEQIVEFASGIFSFAPSGDSPEYKKKKRERETAALRAEANEKQYTPPRTVFPLIYEEGKQKEKEDNFVEIRQQITADDINVAKETKDSEVQEKAAQQDVSCFKTIAELELKVSEVAANTIKLYKEAEIALIEYNNDIYAIVESSVDKVDPGIWEGLKSKAEAKNDLFKQAEEEAKATIAEFDKLKSAVNDSRLEATPTSRATVQRNIQRMKDDIRAAQERYAEEVEKSAIVDKYWRKVECARKKFIDELETMFPEFDIKKKQFNMQPSDLDLFLIHVFATVCYYQKEMNKLDTIAKDKLDKALRRAKDGDADFTLTEIAIKEGLEREKRNLTNEFQRKCLALRKESEMELRHTLKCQEQAHMDHLADVVAAREAELERDFNRKLDEQVALEQGKYKLQMAGMIARMKGMRNAINERVAADKIAHQSQVLWSACQALYRAVKSSVPGIPWTEQMRPLKIEIEAIKKAAADNDELVKIVLAGIPEEAFSRGVFPEGAIRERFLKVERVARRLALVPDSGASLPMYFLSFLQSMLLIKAVNPIPQAELEDETVDFSCLNTYDILQRARYWLDRGNYAQTLKYMNLLRGASRCIAKDWMNETRILLETQQAAETLMAHAVAGGLRHL